MVRDNVTLVLSLLPVSLFVEMQNRVSFVVVWEVFIGAAESNLRLEPKEVGCVETF